jgi:hypothetical protein
VQICKHQVHENLHFRPVAAQLNVPGCRGVSIRTDPGYESPMLTVDPQGLTDAAGQVEASASVLADIDVAGPFSTVSDALVGSKTSQSCLWVSTRLGAAVQVYSEGLQALAGAARNSARDFAGTDHGVASGFGPVGP